MVVRFSTVIGGHGSADTVRDHRDFATKFYINESTCDLVGSDLPVFIIRDAANSQAGESYRSHSKTEKAYFCDNIAVELWKCKSDIIKGVMQYFESADKDFAAGVMRDMEMFRRLGDMIMDSKHRKKSQDFIALRFQLFCVSIVFGRS